MNTPRLSCAIFNILAASAALLSTARVDAQIVLRQAPVLKSVYRVSGAETYPGAALCYAFTLQRGSMALVGVTVVANSAGGGSIAVNGPAVHYAPGNANGPSGHYTVTRVDVQDEGGTTSYNRDGTITVAAGETGAGHHTIDLSLLDFTLSLPSTATKVTQSITSDTTWTAANSPYVFMSDISVAAGVTLTIGPGATVLGGGAELQVFGHLKVAGTADAPAHIENVRVTPGGTTPSQPYSIDVEHADIEGGAFMAPTVDAVYGTVNLRDSYMAHVYERTFLWNPIADCVFERNTFVDAGDFSIGTGGGYTPTITIQNNLFDWPRLGNWNDMQDGGAVVTVWANTGGALNVTGNSFLDVPLANGWVLKLLTTASGQPTTGKMSAPSNYWGSLSADQVSTLILDSTKGSQYPGPIPYLPLLSTPDPATPQANAPTISNQPGSHLANPGDAVTFSVGATTTAAGSYQWKKDGVGIPGATGTTLTLPNVAASDTGNYTVTIADDFGTVTSRVASLSTLTAWLTNVSVRAAVQPGQDPLIVGMATNQTKTILLRASGPALKQFTITNFLSDPALNFYPGGATTPTASNDNWDASLATLAASVGAFPFTIGSMDAALATAVTGQASAIENGPGSGVVLVEAYDTAPDTFGARLVNVSARNYVGTGESVLVAGFAVRGSGTKKVLIRGVGPGLAQFGVTGPLQDPQLQVFTAAGAKIVENDDWDASIAPTFNDTGAFPLTAGSKDAALVVSLAPGSYTAQVSGVNNSTGVALVEIYEAP